MIRRVYTGEPWMVALKLGRRASSFRVRLFGWAVLIGPV